MFVHAMQFLTKCLLFRTSLFRFPEGMTIRRAVFSPSVTLLVHAGMCLCFPPWFCAACVGWRGVRGVGPPLDAEAIKRRRERRARKELCWREKPEVQTLEGRVSGVGEVEMATGEVNRSTSVTSTGSEGNIALLSTTKRDEETGTMSHGSDGRNDRDDDDRDANPKPKGTEKKKSNIDDDNPTDSVHMTHFKPLKLGVFDPRDPRYPSSPTKYGLWKPKDSTSKGKKIPNLETTIEAPSRV